jgi:hypothetical protein
MKATQTAVGRTVRYMTRISARKEVQRASGE